MAPHKWILLPYDRDIGRPLSWASIEQYAGLKHYLIEVRGKLEARKGTLIRSAIAKGVWWSLLGVGPYSFAPYKVIWRRMARAIFSR